MFHFSDQGVISPVEDAITDTFPWVRRIEGQNDVGAVVVTTKVNEKARDGAKLCTGKAPKVLVGSSGGRSGERRHCSQGILPLAAATWKFPAVCAALQALCPSSSGEHARLQLSQYKSCSSSTTAVRGKDCRHAHQCRQGRHKVEITFQRYAPVC